eukprot:Nk52_evm7s233 gene=Nk52_evmTU7s233
MDFFNTFSAAEIEFLAEDEPVQIVPQFKSDTLHFISGEYGPFKPGLPADVPLWLALSLKKRQKCKIKAPEWLTLENLSEKYEIEKGEEGFTKLPEHYLEVATLLMANGVDEVRDIEDVRNKLEDIWELRYSKVRKSLHTIGENDVEMSKMNNLTLMEINSVRPFFVEAMNKIYLLDKEKENLY